MLMLYTYILTVMLESASFKLTQGYTSTTVQNGAAQI